MIRARPRHPRSIIYPRHRPSAQKTSFKANWIWRESILVLLITP
jgi:hypothetical protein